MHDAIIRCLAAALTFGITFTGQSVNAQTPGPTPATARMESFARMVEQAERSLFKNVEFRSIGPTDMVHRSMDQGETWTGISDDLTLGAVNGDVPFGTITALAESPLRFGLPYAGSDDGLIHVIPDGGVSWQRLGTELPLHLWVSRIEPSRHEESDVYLSLNGYRWDHMTPYVGHVHDARQGAAERGSEMAESDEIEIDLDPRDTGKVYLRLAKYEVKVELNGAVQTTSLTVYEDIE